MLTIYRHRDSSPTMRAPDNAHNVCADQPRRSGPEKMLSARDMRAELEGLPKFHRGVDGISYERKTRESFTTISLPKELDQSRIEFPRFKPKYIYGESTCPINLSKQQMTKLTENFRDAPLMQFRNETSRALSQNCQGKDVVGAALQTFENSVVQCEKLNRAYSTFKENADELFNYSIRLNDIVPRTATQIGAIPITTALSDMIESVWPNMRFRDVNEKNVWTARTLRDPNPFIAQSHDALTLAFEEISIAVDSAKADLRNHGRPNDQQQCKSDAADYALLQLKRTFDYNQLVMCDLTREGHSIVGTLRAPLDPAVIQQFEQISTNVEPAELEAPRVVPHYSEPQPKGCCVIS